MIPTTYIAIRETDLSQISSTLRRFAIAASGNFGSDCYIHAAIAQTILAQLGVASKLVVGYAAWRIGNGDGDVILHAPLPNMPPQPGGVAYHMWVEVDNNIIDFTTYQLILGTKWPSMTSTCIQSAPAFATSFIS